MKNTLLPSLLSLSFTCAVLGVAAQLPDSIAGTPDFMGYASTGILCEGNLYVGTSTWSSPSVDPAGFCESIENDQFICFQTADESTVVFEFLLLSCDGTGTGIEVGVIDQNGALVGDCLILDDPSEEGRIELTGLSFFTEYCLRIDGIQGSNCDFQFAAVSGIASDPPNPPGRPEVSAGPYCFGDTLDVSSERIPDASGYLWETYTANAIAGLHYLDLQGQTLSGVSNDSIVRLVIPPFDISRTPGGCDTIWSFVTAYNACGASDPSPERAIIICTTVIDTIVFSVCGSDSLGVEYPAGSGTFYFVNNDQYQTAPAPGGACNEVVAILVEEGQGATSTLEVDTTVCEFPVILEGDTIFSEGIYEYYFPLATSLCDSVVSYTVRSPSSQGAALNNPYCTGDFVRVGTTAFEDAFTYTWTDTDGNLAGDTPNEYLNRFEEPGEYILTISHLGCNHLIEVVVEEAARFEFEVDGDILRVWAQGETDSIAVFFNGEFEAGDSSFIQLDSLPAGPDSTVVLICAFSDCGSTCESIIIDNTSSIQEDVALAELLMWPNPSKGNFNLQLESDQNGIIEVYNFIGKQLFFQYSKYNQQIDLSDQPSGIYLVLLKDESSGLPIARRQVVKQ